MEQIKKLFWGLKQTYIDNEQKYGLFRVIMEIQFPLTHLANMSHMQVL